MAEQGRGAEVLVAVGRADQGGVGQRLADGDRRVEQQRGERHPQAEHPHPGRELEQQKGEQRRRGEGVDQVGEAGIARIEGQQEGAAERQDGQQGRRRGGPRRDQQAADPARAQEPRQQGGHHDVGAGMEALEKAVARDGVAVAQELEQREAEGEVGAGRQRDEQRAPLRPRPAGGRRRAVDGERRGLARCHRRRNPLFSPAAVWSAARCIEDCKPPSPGVAFLPACYGRVYK
ncbi:MAG: hypothetical protein U1E53_04925 [Dongiaceae bacterium]